MDVEEKVEKEENDYGRRAHCDPSVDGGYNALAPTKQNLLCSGRSAIEVILNSQDFKHNNAKRGRLIMRKRRGKTLREEEEETAKSDPWRPRFDYVLPAVPLRLVLALDVSQRMNAGERYARTRDALFSLISRTPVGTEFAVITFDGSGARVAAPPAIVRDTNREVNIQINETFFYLKDNTVHFFR